MSAIMTPWGPVPEEPTPEPPAREQTLDFWLSRKIAEPDFLLGDWLSTTSRVMLVAATGLGKTNFAMALSFAIASGSPFLHWEAKRPARVLYIDGEMSRRLMTQRLKDAARRAGCEPPNIYVLCRDDVDEMPPLNTEMGQRFIERMIDKIGGVDFIFFDNVMCLIDGDMKDEEGWSQVLPWIKTLTRRKIGQFWVHHTGHDESRSYGTKTREWQLDTVMILEAVANPAADISFNLKFTKSRERTPENRTEFEPVTVALADDKWNIIGTAGKTPRLTAKEKRAIDQLQNCLVDSGEINRNGREIPAVTTASVKDWRNRLKATGVTDKEVAKTERGQWSRLQNDLQNKGVIRVFGDRVWLVQQAQRSATNLHRGLASDRNIRNTPLKECCSVAPVTASTVEVERGVSGGVLDTSNLSVPLGASNPVVPHADQDSSAHHASYIYEPDFQGDNFSAVADPALPTLENPPSNFPRTNSGDRGLASMLEADGNTDAPPAYLDAIAGDWHNPGLPTWTSDNPPEWGDEL